MTTAVLESPASRPVPVPLLLGWQEGWRTARHPLSLLGLAALLVLFVVVADNGPRDAFDVTVSGPTWFYGVAVYFAAHLVATRDRRAHAGEWLAAVPASPAERVAGQCLAALVPAAVVTVAVLGPHAVLSATGQFVVAPSVWHLSHAPLTVLGASLLATAVARTTSLPGAGLLVMVGMVLVDAWLSNRPYTLSPLATYVSWPLWAPTAEWVGMSPGSPAWHTAYLAALCAMAAAAAFLRVPGLTRPAVLAGGVATLAAAVTGVLQLP